MTTEIRGLWRRRCAAAIAALALALVPLACGGDDEGGGGKSGGPAKDPEKAIEALDGAAKEIAIRIEGIRGLEFDQVPSIEPVTAAESAAYLAKRAGEAPKSDQLANEETIKLLGLVPKGATTKGLSSSLGAEAVLGFYDPRRKRLALVAGPAAKEPKALEGLAAHELLHALQDQKFGTLDRLFGSLPDTDADAATALSSVIEGDATVVQKAYAKRYGAVADFEGDKAQREQVEKLPFALLLAASFPYTVGAEFVQALAKKSPKLLDKAFTKPPTSTAQIIHPELFLAGEEPQKVSLNVGPTLGGGWRRLDDNTFGELDAITLLAFDEKQVEGSEKAADGWRGGRYELWRQGALDPKACPAPCVKRDVLVIGSRWKTAKDAQEFAAALGASLKANRGGKPAGPGVYTVADGGVAARASGSSVTVAYAPTPQMASKVAATALGK